MDWMTGSRQPLLFLPRMASTASTEYVSVRDWMVPAGVFAWVQRTANALKADTPAVLLAVLGKLLCELDGAVVQFSVCTELLPDLSVVVEDRSLADIVCRLHAAINCAPAGSNADGDVVASDARSLQVVWQRRLADCSGLVTATSTEYHGAQAPVLTLAVTEDDRDALTLHWVADVAAIDRSGVAHLARQFETILLGLTNGLDFSAAMRRCALEEACTATGSEPPAHISGGSVTILDQFYLQAYQTPDAIALSQPGMTISYAMARRIVTNWAEQLHSVARDWVAIDAVSDAGTILLMLAAWRAGLGYVPLDLEAPAARVRSIAGEFGSSLVLATTRDLQAQAVDFAGCLSITTFNLTEAAGRADSANCAFTPNPICYVVLTSGSTGAPKGVCITHDALAVSTQARMNYYGNAPRRFLLLSPCYVDSAVAGIFWTLAHGGELVVAPTTMRQDPRAITGFLLRGQPSHLLCLPSLYQLCLEELPANASISLSHAIVAAEVVPHRAVMAHEAKVPSVQLFNEYGPSEGTVWATAHHCSSAVLSVPIGRAVDHLDLVLSTDDDQDCLVGAQGEIRLGGEGLAIGYWNRPVETAARFRPDNRPDRPGARQYRTGDFARRTASGYLTFHGRKDGQVKLNGYRVELEEVRSCLEASDQVAEAFVAVSGAGEAASLVAWVSPRSGNLDEIPETMRRWVAERLPQYMRPAIIVPVSGLPRLRSGKIAANELPDSIAVLQARSRSSESLLTNTEQVIAHVWQDVLSQSPIGRTANFFELGGNSFQAIHVVACLRDDLGTEDLGIHHLMEHPVLAEFALLVDQILCGGAPAALPRIVSSGAFDQPRPASPFQQRLYLLHQLGPLQAAYHCPFVLFLEGHPDVASLRTAFRQTVEQFPVLNSNFAIHRGEVCQLPGATLPATLEMAEDMLPSDPTTFDAVLLREIERPFDLQSDALHRARLFRTERAEWVLVITIHHIVFDGWSIGIFAQLLGEHYRALSQGIQLEPRPEPAVQFHDFAAWQHQRWEQGDLRHQLNYWREHLAGVDPWLELPTDQGRPHEPRFSGETIHFNLDRSQSRLVTDSCRRFGVTPFILLQSCFALILNWYSGQADFLVGTALALRSQPGTDSIVGPLVNTAVIRNQLQNRMTFAELVGNTRLEVAGMRANADVPFEKVVEALAPERSPGRMPLFQVMFVMQETGGLSLDLGDIGWRLRPHRSSYARFDLSMAMSEDADGFHGQLEFSTELFSRDSVDHIIASFLRVIELGAATPDLPLWRFRELDVDAEATALLDELESGGTPVSDVSETLSLRILRTAAVRPDATALCCGGHQVSYRTMCVRAARLASLLAWRGVGTDDSVAVLMPRSTQLPIALLGILMAGAGFLPLELDAPAGRIESVWRAAGRPLIVHGDVDCELLPREAHTIDIADACEAGSAGQCTIGTAFPESLAYVMHTSGSSGQPKGVMIPHSAIVNRLDWMQARFGLRPGQRVLQKTPLTFDVCVWELFWPLREGGCLVLAAAGEHRDPTLLRHRLEREQIEVVHFVPSMLSAFLRGRGFVGLSALREVICSGEALTAAQARDVHDQSSSRLTNLYGPTEAAVDVTAWTCDPAAVERVPPIGRPIGGIRCRVLDHSNSRAAVKAPGELYIGGVALARGYVGQPRLTAESFLPDPYDPVPGSRIYRTGDRARFGSDGAILFLGRIDAQIKVRGIRVEPAEIEATLQQHPDVSEAAVQQHPHSPGTLLAYVVPNQVTDELESELQVFARRKLPPQLVPSLVVLVDSLPKSASGKLDRKRLVAPPSDADGPYPPPAAGARNETERRLARLWQEQLPGGVVDLDKGFFANGGHSLLGVRLGEAIAEEFSITLPLDLLLSGASFREIGRWIDNIAWLSDAAPGEPNTNAASHVSQLI
jgi:amino acid adenylation domain-containing protein